VILGLCGGDRPAFHALRPRLHRLAFAWCHDAALADDLVQEPLTKALARAGQLKAEGAVASWLIAILNNCWRDHLRRVRGHLCLDEAADWPDLHAQGPEDTCSQGQLVTSVREAIARLPLGQREVLTLVDFEESSYAEAAAALGIPVGTVMSRLARARAALREQLLQGSAERAPVPLRRVK
jgi:RNA polymerase sigma-70 factor (ECF subfamily)